MFPDGTVRYSHVAVPDAAFEKTEFYNDYFRPENYFYSFGIKIPLPDQKPTYLAIMRSREKGPYGPEEGSLLTELLPHLQQALRLHYQFVSLRSSLEATLDHLPYGLALLDANGRCVLMNREARRIVDKKDGLLLVDSRLAAQAADESASLRALIARIVSPGKGGRTRSSDAVLVSRRDGVPLQLVVAPTTAGIGDVPVQAVATVYIRDPQAEDNADSAHIFRSLYGLTKAEARLTTLLLQGRDIPEIAELNNVTRETVRSQLKSVFQKTGTRRQAELIRLLATIPRTENC